MCTLCCTLRRLWVFIFKSGQASEDQVQIGEAQVHTTKAQGQTREAQVQALEAQVHTREAQLEARETEVHTREALVIYHKRAAVALGALQKSHSTGIKNFVETNIYQFLVVTLPIE